MFAITRITNFNILSIILCSWVVHSEVHKTDVTQLPAGTKKVILKIPDGPYFARENMIITCEFKYFVNFDKRNIRITINGTALSNTTEDINENNFLNIIVTIEIQSLLESHTGLYKCAYYSTNDFLEAEKDIKVWPELQKPKCQASPSYYTEGENVTLTCTATVIYPSLELIWNTGDISLTNPHIITIASKDIHLSKYTCHMIVSLHEWSSVPLFCNVNITRLLKVTINISNVILGQRTTLKCIVHDAHQNLNYTWTYQEINNYFKCDNTNCSNGTNFLIDRDITNSLTIQNVTEDMDNSKITCEVKGLNVIGNHTIILQVNRLHETEITTGVISNKITNKISTTEMNISYTKISTVTKAIIDNQQVTHGKNDNSLFQLPIIVTVVGSTLILHICIYYIKKSSNSRRHQSIDMQSSNLDNVSSYITAHTTTNASSSFNATLNKLDEKKSDENPKLHIYHDISKTSDDATDGYLIPMCRIEQVQKEGTPKNEDQSQDIEEHPCNVMVRSTSNLSNADKNVKSPEENTYHYISTTSDDVTDGYLTSTRTYYKSLMSIDQIKSYHDQSSVDGQHKQYEEPDPLYLDLE